MDRPTDELLHRLLTAADLSADPRTAQLIAEATAEAEAEVRGFVKRAVTAALLRRVVAELDRGSHNVPTTDAGTSSPLQFPQPPDVQAEANKNVGGASYLYCITRDSPANNVLIGPDGVERANPPRVLERSGLRAIISTVTSDTFSAAALAERGQDLEWVGQKVRVHDRVIKQAMEGGAVIPLRFGTVLRGEQAVAKMLTRHRDELAAKLDRLDGRREWGVKVLARSADVAVHVRATPASPAGASQGAKGAGRGKTYLRERARANETSAVVRERLRQYVQECHEKLAARADEAKLLTTRRAPAAEDAEFAGEGVWPAMNGAYLVEDERADEFGATFSGLAQRFDARGLTLQLTGPWPAYNFVELDVSNSEPSE